ncbi:MAG: hypothetical protein QF856_07015 [Candidatus Marinimicrobia bacterium]|jgi:hypothetical protein|nr:hypothetical protein [Candidatus Neomarinimicrobiota bacterium]
MDNISKIKLYQLPRAIKLLLMLTVLNLTVGVGIGLYYVSNTTHLSPEGTAEQFRGSSVDNNFDIPEKFPKPTSELLTTTHNHIISMTFIFFIMGGIFYFNSIITGFWKSFFIAEPFFSILATFGGIWFIRFIHSSFSYLVMVSGVLMYLSFFIMAGTIIYELSRKK